MIYITGCGFMTGITDSRGSEVCVTEVRLNHANFGQAKFIQANFLRRESLLTVTETASLMGVTERHVRRLIANGAISANTKDGRGGAGGTQYSIPLAALDERFRLKYERKLRGCSEPPPDETGEFCLTEFCVKPQNSSTQNSFIKPLNILSLTEDERDEIAQWETITREWQRFRFDSGMSAAEADAEFIAKYQTKYPTVTISRRILYKRWAAVKDGDKAALYDKRGKHGNHARLVSDLMWDIFLSCYLDESKPSAEKCVTDVWLELEAQVREGLLAEMPKMPQTSAFLRKAKTIPRPVLAYFRGGEYEYSSECAPYIRREYDNIDSNDWWVADNHTFDVVLWDGKAPVRMYLTAFMDARSRKMAGWCVTDRPNSDATLCATEFCLNHAKFPGAVLRKTAYRKGSIRITGANSCSTTSAVRVSGIGRS
jgi:excisionase family DNA binding protein